MENELTGVAPQKLATNARGVSLTQPERTFLDALASYTPHYEAKLALVREREEQKETSFAPALDDPFNAIVPSDYIPGACTPAREPKAHVFTDKARLELAELGAKVGLRDVDVDYIVGWVVYQGLHWSACSGLRSDEIEGNRIFRNPVVRKLLNAAAELGLCNGTTASKEEVADYLTQRMRSPVLPDAVRDNAADKLSRLMGYYPKESGGGQGSVNVQINCVNPYGSPVKAEVVG